MAGRPPLQEDEKKLREAIYFEPHLLSWLESEAKRDKCTVSVIVNKLVQEKMSS